MIVHSVKTGNTPLVLHAPGIHVGKSRHQRYNRVFFQSLEKLRRTPAEPVDALRLKESLTIITCSNSTRPGLLDESLARLGLEAMRLGRDIRLWRNIEKVALYRQALDWIESPYVMGLDFDDVIVLRDPYEAVETFESMACDMLFNAECSFYPDYLRDEAGVAAEWQQFQRSLATTEWAYLNAGCFIAKTEFFRRFVEACECAKIEDLVSAGRLPLQPVGFHQRSVDSEQVVVHSVFRDLHPQVNLDREHRVFMNTIHVPPGPHFVRLNRGLDEIPPREYASILLSFLPLRKFPIAQFKRRLHRMWSKRRLVA